MKMRAQFCTALLLLFVGCSDDVLMGVADPPPAVPTLQVVEEGSGQIEIGWNNVPGATSYGVEWMDFRTRVPQHLNQIAGTRHQLTELSESGFYRIRVRSFKRFVGSEYSEPTVAETYTPRTCTAEREAAMAFGSAVIPREWDGTPIRVDMLRNFPDFVTDAELEYLLEPIGELARDIEEQIGYPVLEKGSIVDLPAGADPDFNASLQDLRPFYYFPREKHQILAIYVDDQSPDMTWDGRGPGPLGAMPLFEMVFYNTRALGDWWHERDPCCPGPNGKHGQTIVHELFHVLGYGHQDWGDRPPSGRGVLMKLGAVDGPWHTGSKVYYAAHGDIDALKCIFPRGP